MNEQLQAVARLRDEPLSAEQRKILRREILADWVQAGPVICAGLLQAEKPTALIILDLIGGSRDESCLEAVRTVAQSKANERVRHSAAIALGQIDGDAARDALIGLLSDASPAVRLGGICGLKVLGDRCAIDALGVLAQDKAKVRAWWPGSKAGHYEVGTEAMLAIQELEESS